MTFTNALPSGIAVGVVAGVSIALATAIPVSDGNLATAIAAVPWPPVVALSCIIAASWTIGMAGSFRRAVRDLWLVDLLADFCHAILFWR